MKKVLIVTDNGLLLKAFRALLGEVHFDAEFIFMRSFSSRRIKAYEEGIRELDEVNMKTQSSWIVSHFDLAISLHCKQIFPPEVVNHLRCINVHPGYNPINRGWYPQVFALIKNLPIGATIHEMDEGIDTGRIIDRVLVEKRPEDTSKDLYERVLEAEMQLLRKNLPNLLEGNYVSYLPEAGGNYFSRKDFDDLCHLDLQEKLSMGQAIDKLRALSHGDYKNAWFYASNGDRIYVSIALDRKTV